MFDESKMKWLIYAPEVCPTTGREHWQGFVYWKSAKTVRACSGAFGNVHVEPKARHASFEDNLNYIKGPYMKNGKEKPENPDFKEYGEMPQQGARADLEVVRDAMLEGATNVAKILMETPHLYHQYGRTMMALEDQIMSGKERTSMTKGIWYYGPTGCGKTTAAMQRRSDGMTLYTVPDDGGWRDLYRQQDVVLMDDFRGRGIPYDMMLRLVDRWPMSVRRRGRCPLPFTSGLVVVTSSLPPWKVFKKRTREDGIAQLFRRFEVFEMSPDGTCTAKTEADIPPSEVDENGNVHFIS